MNELTRPALSRMTRDEFLAWHSPGPLRWQLVDGEAVEMAPTTEFHGAIQAELIRLIGNHLADTGSECRVIDASGIIPRARAEMNYRIPDVGVTCSPILNGSFVDQPILLAEILSVSNEIETRANVWTYTTIPGLLDILLLRSSRMEAELLQCGSDGRWPANPTIIGADAQLTLASIGLTLPLAALYRTTGLQR